MTFARVGIVVAALATVAALGTTACGGKSCASIPCPAPGGFDQSTCECVSGSVPPSGGRAGEGGAALGGGSSGDATGFGGAGGSGEAGTGSSNCSEVACPAILGVCADGYHYGAVVGQCCPGCVPDSTDNCAQGQSNYQAFSKTQIGQNNSCKVGSDCVAVNETNDCSANGCGDLIGLNVSSQVSVVSALDEYASNNCRTCPPLAPEACVRIDTPLSCLNGACTFVIAPTSH